MALHNVVERVRRAFAGGKTRDGRRVLEPLGLTVNRLIRIAYGPFQLGRLARGQVDAVPAKVLREQLGIGADGGRKTGFAKAKPRPPKPGARTARSTRTRK